MNVRDLCLDLAYSENENAVEDVLSRSGYWSEKTSWQNFSGRENNFSLIGNQQAAPDAALVEKLINSVDAILMAECMSRGISPEGEDAPQNMQEAIEQFYGISGGNLADLSSSERSRYAEKICLIATGSKLNPSYSIFDQGEGQYPIKMLDTFLSLGNSNKLRIPFVQGKFNMGGTGILQFCGKKNFQLIISKRHPEVAKLEWGRTDAKKWGFTIIRREDPPSKGVRSSIYKYLAPDGEILSFESDSLPILPDAYPSPYGKPMKYGTFVKLYNYQIGPYKSNIQFDLYKRLSLLMTGIGLPIRLYERREGYRAHTYETTLAGLSVRLEDDSRNNLEPYFPASASLTISGQPLTVKIYAFKKGQDENYRKGEGVIFLLNGQTHGHLPKTFFSRQSVGMAYLADSLLIVIDCSEVDGRTREDLFMNSRDRLREGEFRKLIEDELSDLLKNHPGLKELRERRRREDLDQRLEDAKPLEAIIQSLLKKDPDFARLLIEGVRVVNPVRVTTSSMDTRYEGKRFPSFFTLIDKFPFDKPKGYHQNNERFRIKYKTDVENEYFDRVADAGIFTLTLNSEPIDEFSLNLWNGVATLSVQIPAGVRIGDILHFSGTLEDINHIQPFTEDFFVTVKEQQTPSNGQQGKRTPPSSNSKGNESHKQNRLDIPPIKFVKMDEWDKHSFDSHSALRVVDNGEGGHDFYVNIDNVYLTEEKKRQAKSDPKILEFRYCYGMVIIGMALLREHLDLKKFSQASEDTDKIYERIQSLTKALSRVFLPMISALGKSVEEELQEIFDPQE